MVAKPIPFANKLDANFYTKYTSKGSILFLNINTKIEGKLIRRVDIKNSEVFAQGVIRCFT